MFKKIISFLGVVFFVNLYSMEHTPLLPDQKNNYSKEQQIIINNKLSDDDLIKKYSKTTCKQDCDYFMVVHLALSGGPDHRQYITNAELRAIKERMIEDGITDVQLQQSIVQEYMKHKNKLARRAINCVCGLAVASGITIVMTAIKAWQYF